MNKEATEKPVNCPVPKSVKNVESSLGFANYYCDQFRYLADLSTSLYNLTGCKTVFHWSEQNEQDFNQIKERLI